MNDRLKARIVSSEQPTTAIAALAISGDEGANIETGALRSIADALGMISMALTFAEEGDGGYIEPAHLNDLIHRLAQRAEAAIDLASRLRRENEMDAAALVGKFVGPNGIDRIENLIANLKSDEAIPHGDGDLDAAMRAVIARGLAELEGEYDGEEKSAKVTPIRGGK